MILYIVRHGESESNWQGKWGGHYNTSLTPKGLEQAKQLTNELVNTSFEIIISSSLIRARQTVEIIQERFNYPLILSNEFMERNMGVFEGLTQEEIIERYPDLWNRRCTRKLDDAPTNGETYRQFDTRITCALLKLKEDYPDENVLLVTHNFVARVINKFFMNLSFDEMHDFQLGNCEIAKYSM